MGMPTLIEVRRNRPGEDVSRVDREAAFYGGNVDVYGGRGDAGAVSFQKEYVLRCKECTRGGIRGQEKHLLRRTGPHNR
jgi:hypothetical protein